jgi:large subunit ribosomal protein L35
MPKNKSHKGLLKRIKITKSGKVKIGRAGGRHLKSRKKGDLIQSYRKATYALAPDIGRLSKMLHRPLLSQEEHARLKERKAELKSESAAA